MTYAVTLPTLPAPGDAPALEPLLGGLAAFARGVLARHDADFARTGAVATYFSKPALKVRSRADRIAIMCASDRARERYAEVEHVGERNGSDVFLSGEPVAALDRVRLWTYWGVHIEDDDLEAEAREFRAAMRSTDPAAPGLVALLRQAGHFIVTATASGVSERWEVEARIEEVAYSFYEVDAKNHEWRHEAAVTLTLSGAPA